MDMNRIAVVVPTIREESINAFKEAWQEQFQKYNVELYIVHDGHDPYVEYNWQKFSVKDVMGKHFNLILNHNDGVRNLGFAKAYKDGADIIISLDDDVRPCGDTIGDHLKALEGRQPISWINTVDDIYMRGFPYGVRQEAETVFSHGLWEGVYDFDASTQLVLGTQQPRHRKMPIPKGVLFPVCVMNVAFKSKVLPFYYQAPMFGDINRFADIWSGIEMKKAIDEKGWGAVSGYAVVKHERASNPFTNLVKEAKGVGHNETLWYNGEYGNNTEAEQYFTIYKQKQDEWRRFLEEC